MAFAAAPLGRGRKGGEGAPENVPALHAEAKRVEAAVPFGARAAAPTSDSPPLRYSLCGSSTGFAPASRRARSALSASPNAATTILPCSSAWS